MQSDRLGHIVGVVAVAAFVIAIANYAGDAEARSAPAHTIVAAQDCVVVPDSTGIAQRARSTTPATMTWHQFDSLAKNMNIKTKYIGPYDTASKYVSREMVMQLLNARGEYRGRDSSYLFLGEGCIQVELRIGTTASDDDTIIWRDICQDACFDSLTVPLGCWKDSSVIRTDTATQRTCDTTCAATVDVVESRMYWVWQGLAAVDLTRMSCKKTWSAGTMKLKLYNGQWYQPYDTLAYGDPHYPATDSCYVDAYVWAWYIQECNNPFSGRAGWGPWLVDTTVSGGTQTIPVDCGLYGQPNVIRIVSNCRDSLITSTRTDVVRVFVDSGRDTTIWDNACDCMKPVFVCSEKEDSVRSVKYIYCYTADTLKEICEKEYNIPVYDYYPAWPQPRYEICEADPELDTTYSRWLQLRWAYGTDTRTSATQRHVRVISSGVGKDTCWSWSCQTFEDVPPVGPADFWIEGADIDAFFPCPGPRCVLELARYETITDWCCEKDTVATYTCFFEDTENSRDTTVTFKIPDRTQLCRDSTIVGITPSDSTICDSIVTWIKTYKTVYILSYEDTCCYTPTINGEPFCDLWIVDDCSGRPLYRDANGVWHIPCAVADANGDGLYDGTDYEYIANNDTWLSHRIDSALAHQSAVDMAGRAWGGRITPNGDGTVAVGKGMGFVKQKPGGPQDIPLDDPFAAAISHTFPVFWDSVAVLHLTDTAYNYIYYDYSGDSIAVTTDFYSIDSYQDFTLGRSFRLGTEVIARLCGTNIWSFDRRVQLFGEEYLPVVRAKGMAVGAGSFRSLTVTAGVIWAELVNRFPTAAADTRTDSMRTWIRNGTGWRDSMVTAIDSINYDDGTGVLQPLTANRYGVHWIYIVHDGSVHSVYGQGDYTLTQAQTAGVPTLPPLLAAYATLRAKIIIQKSAGSFTSLESPDDVRFSVTPVTDHNSLSGLQGGTTSEYYHTTSAQATAITAFSGKWAGFDTDIGVHRNDIDGIRDSLAMLRDSIGVLRTKIDSLQTVLDGMSAGGDSSWALVFEEDDVEIADKTIFLADAGARDINVNEPGTMWEGLEFVIKRTDDGSGGHSITFNFTVDGTTNPTLDPKAARRLVYSGSAWYFIGY